MSRKGVLLAALAVVIAYLGLEWLFLATMPSFLGMLPLPAKVALLCSAFALVAPLFVAIVGLLSLVRPEAGLALVAVASGCLLFLMADNFLYTVLELGTLGTPREYRVVYTALLLLLIWCSYRRLAAIDFTRPPVRRLILAVALCGIAVAAAAQALRAPVVRLTDDPPAEPRSTPNILFIGMDGVEAHTLSVYGSEFATTPFLDSVADELLIFDSAYPDSGKTTGTTTALLTGRSPFATHVGFPPQVLLASNSFLHLPAILNELGYTGFQYAIPYYADAVDLNLRNGFAHVNGRRPPLREIDTSGFVVRFNDELHFVHTLAERLVKRLRYAFFLDDMVNLFLLVESNEGLGLEYDLDGLRSLEEFVDSVSGPFYAHVHLMSTHCCTHKPRSSFFEPGDFTKLRGQTARSMTGRMNAIRDLDGLIGTIYDLLANRDLLEETILVVYSDHSYRWDSVKRVPLLLRFPRREHAGHYTGDVLLSTVPSLLLEHIGLPRPSWMRSDVDLAAVGAGDAPLPRPIFGLRKFAYRRYSLGAGGLSKVNSPGPPNYGISEVSMIFCSKPFTMSLSDGRIRPGTIEGELARCPDPDPSGIALLFQRRMLEYGLERGN